MNEVRRFWQQHTESWRGLLLVTLLGLPFVWPLLRWTTVPCTHDGHLHYHRVAAMRHAWENGVFFSRWLPDLAFGYGFPFFVFREPLPLYVTQFFFMAGLPLPAATNLFYLLCLLASGWFMFLWVRDVAGPTAGLVSGMAYLAAPYLLIDVYVRGNQVESLGLALLPLLLWAGRRFVQRGSLSAYLVGIAGLVVLSLSHNISLFLFAPVLGFYLLLMGYAARLPWRTTIARLLLLCGLGLSLTLFYTGSAVTEINSVALDQSVSRRNNDFRFNFASLAEIFSPVPAEDPGALNPPLPLRLGWAPAGLALLGLLSLLRRPQRELRLHIIFMALVAAGCLFMAHKISTPLWEMVPLIDFVQFPWRFVGRAALPVAFLAGVGGAASCQLLAIRGRRSAVSGQPSVSSPAAIADQSATVSREKPAAHGPLTANSYQLTAILAVALLALEAWPYLYPAICAEDAAPTIVDVHRYERETGMVGVDPTGSYFPRTVAARPAGSALETAYLAGTPPQRFDESSLPAGASLLSTRSDGLASAATVDAAAPFTARYLTFAFPGWMAYVDGQPVPVTATDPEGLISFPVPAGQHELLVRWESTRRRSALGAISLLALAAVILTSLVLYENGPERPRTPRPALPALPYWLGLALLLALLKFGLVDLVENPLRRRAEPPVDVTLAIQGAELALAGYDISQTTVPAGGTFDVDLAWQVLAPPAAVYQSNLWLVDADGLQWSNKDTERTRLYEDPPDMRFWPAGDWAWDSREVAVLSGTPPGQYDLVLTLFRLADLQPLTLTGGDGAVLGPTTVIGQITVVAPAQPPQFTPQFPTNAMLGPLTLFGYNQDRAEAAPGDSLLLTLFWGNDAQPSAGLDYTLTLQTENGLVVADWLLPVGSLAPDERRRGQYLLRLPAALASGRYQLHLGPLPLGDLLVQAPERNFEQPLDLTLSGQFYDENIELVGYRLTEEDAGLKLDLVWRGLAEIPERYRVFVHLIGADGEILAQSDGEPAGWRRPTTGWAPGEFISDSHTLALPAGVIGYDLRVGLYDPATGQRLPVAGGDFVVIPAP